MANSPRTSLAGIASRRPSISSRRASPATHADAPKGAKGLKTELASVINEQVTVTVNGKSKKMPTLRLILKALAGKAAKGNVAAADKLLTMVINAFGFEDERTAAKELSDTEKLILAHLLGETTEEPSRMIDLNQR